MMARMAQFFTLDPHDAEPHDADPHAAPAADSRAAGAGTQHAHAQDWRAGMLALVLRLGLLVGIVAYVPSVLLAWRVGLWPIVLLDTIALAAIAAMHLVPRVPYRVRAHALCFVVFVLGSALLHWVGIASELYLFAASILTSLLLGNRVGLVMVVLTSATVLLLGVTGNVAGSASVSIPGGLTATWVVLAVNFLVVDFIVTTGVGVVLNTIETARRKELKARDTLDLDRLLLRALFDALPDAVFTKDLEGRYTHVNLAAVHQTGRTHASELLGKTAFDVQPAAVAETVQQDDRDVTDNAIVSTRELQLGAANEEQRWYLLLKAPLRDDNGGIVGLVGITRDITARKRAEFERDRNMAQLELQIERMPVAYILTDAALNCVRWNPAAARIFGFTESEVIGKPVFDMIVHPASHPAAKSILQQIREGRMDAHGEFINVTRAGVSITCEWHNTPLFDESGAYSGLLSLAQDITARKKLESQLLQSQKMEAIGQLAGGVAHDFNNLLTVIFGYSEMLLADPRSSENTRESAQAINGAATRAASLTGQLLAFSRKTMLQPQVLIVNDVVAETSAMLHRLIGEDIKLETALDPTLRAIRVDPGQLAQILLNLAVNARDAMPRGGTLTIETANVTLSEEYAATQPECKAGPHIMLAVTDTGTGMTPEVQSRIFEPFFTTKGVGAGTGLGLATVFGIVQQSGGSIHVYSETGTGSAFKIYFPALVDSLGTTGDAQPLKVKGGVETVLVVEDDEAVRRLATMALCKFGYTVIAAANGQEAIDLVASNRNSIRVLLTDVVMPGMSGPQLVAALRDYSPALKTLFMSGYTDDAVVRHGLLAADVSFIQKPFTPAGLAHKIRQVIDS